MTLHASVKPSQRLVIVLATVTAIITLGLVGLGSTVRVTNSGMGCPSWPLCYGQLGPIYSFHAILEESHRYLAATVSVFVVATLLATRKTPKLKLTRLWSTISAGLVLLQVLLGGRAGDEQEHIRRRDIRERATGTCKQVQIKQP